MIQSPRNAPAALAGALALALAFPTAARAADEILLKQTLAVSLGGHEVGTIEALDKKTPGGVEMTRVTKLTVQRGTTMNEMKTTTLVKLKPDLSPVSYRYERRDASGTLVAEGRIVEGHFELSTTQNGATVKNTSPLAPGTTFSLAVEQETRTKLKDGLSLQRTVILEEMGAPVVLKVSVKKTGESFKISSEFQGIQSEEEVDARGRTLVARTPSMNLVAYPIGRAPPDLLTGGTADLMALSTWMTKVVRPPVSRVLYRITAPDAESFSVPEDERQKIKERTKKTIVVEVKAGNTFTGPLSPERRKALTSATPYEATQDPRIVRAAAEAAKGAVDKRDEVKRLVDFVFKHVDAKGLDRGYAPAIATLEGRAGDCTEHSVLLSALLRARGFPTRLIDGIIVDGAKAGYHEWVEVYLDGEGFVPADPTFGAFPAGPERLKLAEGSTMPDEHLQLSLAAARLLAPGVKVEVLEAIPAPPTR
jgi:hypothetical protein